MGVAVTALLAVPQPALLLFEISSSLSEFYAALLMPLAGCANATAIAVHGVDPEHCWSHVLPAIRCLLTN